MEQGSGRENDNMFLLCILMTQGEPAFCFNLLFILSNILKLQCLRIFVENIKTTTRHMKENVKK